MTERSKAAQLSRALSEAGFLNKHAMYTRYRRAWKATGEPPEYSPRPGGERGWFKYYADPRADNRKRLKFQVRTDSNTDALEAQDIAKKVVPEADTWLSPNGQMVTIVWTE